MVPELQGAREPGRQGPREPVYPGTYEPVSVDPCMPGRQGVKKVGTASLDDRWPWNQGTRYPGSQGAWEPGTPGAREPEPGKLGVKEPRSWERGG